MLKSPLREICTMGSVGVAMAMKRNGIHKFQKE